MCTSKFFIYCVSFLSISFFAKAQQEEPLNSGVVLQKASKLYDERDYKKAIELYKTVSRNDTNYSLVLHELSFASYMDSNYANSISYAKQGLIEFPEKSFDWYNLLGKTNDIMGNHKEALLYYNSLLVKNPFSYLGWCNKGIAYYNQENYTDAKMCLQKALLIFPYHTASHYFLGVVAAKEGKIIPAMLSFTTSLLMRPEGAYASSSVSYLNNIAKVTDDIAGNVSSAKTWSNDDFELLQEIILSKAAFDKRYKLKTDLEDPITRQLQVMLEKLEYNAADNGFWMQFYVPFYKDILPKDQFDLMVNYMFSGLDIKSIKNFNQKNDKKISVFVTDAASYFDDIEHTEKLKYADRIAANKQYYFSNGNLLGIGKWNVNGKDETFTGPWSFYYESGQLKSKGSFNESGNKDGNWEFYHENGRLKQTCTFDNGNVEGKLKAWFTNGNLSEETMYKNNMLNGESKTYFFSGLLQTFTHYKDDKKEGEEKGFTYNGFPDYIATYKNGALDGVVYGYYKNGKISVQKNYALGKLNGVYKTFSNNGTVTLEGNYETDRLSGQWKEYYDSKAIKSEYAYKDGAIDGAYKLYYENGKPRENLQYTNGKANGKEEDFDEDDIKFSESVYENGRLRELSFFDKTGKTINTFSTRKGAGNLTFYDSYGTKDNEAYFNKEGYRNGKSIYYFPSGKIRNESNFIEGSLNGERKLYYATGQVSEKMNYKDNDENGMLKSYHINGNLKYTGYYSDGNKEGEHISYNILGTEMASYYYLDNEQSGYTVYNSANGKKDFEEKYYRGWLQKTIQYDTLGNVISTSEFPGGNGELIYKHYNGKVYVRSTYRNYLEQGKYETFYFDGTPSLMLNYKNGLKDSLSRSFFYGGKLQNEGSYVLGKKNGEWKYYYNNGKLYYTETYVDGEEQGIETLYNEDGTKDKTINYNKGNLDGAYTLFGDNNEAAIQLNYHDDVLISYTYYGKDGKMVAPIIVNNGTAMVTAYYKNGNKSAEINFENSQVNGVRKIYFTNASLYIDGTRVVGYENGNKKIYYQNGKLEKEENYLYGNMHGLVKSYYENGNIKAEENWYNGERNGASKYFDESGKLKETRFYYYDLLLSVTKG